MATTTSLWTSDAAKVIDTAGVKVAVDVGGATGSLLHLLLEANPGLRGVVFDRPSIVGAAAWRPRNAAWRTASTLSAVISSGRSAGRPLRAEDDPPRLG